jgi:peptidoglycan-associated lipoprotein
MNSASPRRNLHPIRHGRRCWNEAAPSIRRIRAALAAQVAGRSRGGHVSFTVFLEGRLSQLRLSKNEVDNSNSKGPVMGLSLTSDGAARSFRPVLLAAFTALALTGCAKKNTTLPNNPGDLGLGQTNGAQPGTKQDFTVNVGDRVFFDTDSSAIRADAQTTLTRQAQWLSQYPNYQVTIEGHADERGTRAYNLALGARRAAAARDFLAARGVNRARIKTISYGKERPVATCDDISCWSQNRRAVTVLTD